MSDISERYDRLSAAFKDKVAAVPPDAWDGPTPCAEWTVRDLVRHVVDTHAIFLGLVDRTVPPGPSVDEEPVEAFDAARRTVLALLEDPATASETYEGAFGVQTLEWAIDRFCSFDLVVHGWDLARATGQDEAIAPEEVARIRADAEAMGDRARQEGVFGPALEPPAGADEQTRVLALVGRRA